MSTASSCGSSTTCSRRCYESELGIALAAPQIGVQKQIFVWDLGDGEREVIFNPEIVESDGEWVYDEGCLSIPGLYVEMLRPKTVLMRGVDIDGEVVEREADELEARMYQHELDHLHGVLMFDRMQPEQRKEAMAEFRRLQREAAARPPRSRAAAASLASSSEARLPRHAGDGGAAARGAGRRRSRHRARRHRRRQTAGAGQRDVAEPRSRLPRSSSAWPVSHDVDDVIDVGAELGVVVAFGRIIKPHVLAERADGQPALLAAATLARCGAGRAGAAGGRRDDRCVRDGGRGRARHRRRVRPGRCADRRRRRPRTSSASELVDVGTRLLVDTLRSAASVSPTPQIGAPTYAAKIDPAELRIDWSRAGASRSTA